MFVLCEMMLTNCCTMLSKLSLHDTEEDLLKGDQGDELDLLAL